MFLQPQSLLTISPCCQGREQNSLYQSFKDELAQDDVGTWAMLGWMGEAKELACEESVKSRRIDPPADVQRLSRATNPFHEVSECKNHKTIRALNYQSLSFSRTQQVGRCWFPAKDCFPLSFSDEKTIRCVGSAQFICNEGAVPIFADSHQRHSPCSFVCGSEVGSGIGVETIFHSFIIFLNIKYDICFVFFYRHIFSLVKYVYISFNVAVTWLSVFCFWSKLRVSSIY